MIADKINGLSLPREVHQTIPITVNGTNLTGAVMVAFFKQKLSLPDDDPTTIKKGNTLPLTGITFSIATDTQIVAAIALNPSDYSVLPSDPEVQLHYAINLKETSGQVHKISDGVLRIRQTAILQMP